MHNLLKQKNTAELHNLLGEIEEKDGQFVAAANEYEAAAHMDPSESNLFDWGSEMLLHRTLGSRDRGLSAGQRPLSRFAALMIGLGMALYARGNYDDAVKSLLQAADLNPSDPAVIFFFRRPITVRRARRMK